ncbi:uncharacterized protein LOC102455524 isoform X3 [Pelodiscus sinensis]|uniref:uncharacterized protein LOC102455524 isoform X3 n=2 Tax=Pelodiscus sinensis TaxID=13735 RepID=UPI003F6A8D6A
MNKDQGTRGWVKDCSTRRTLHVMGCTVVLCFSLGYFWSMSNYTWQETPVKIFNTVRKIYSKPQILRPPNRTHLLENLLEIELPRMIYAKPQVLKPPRNDVLMMTPWFAPIVWEGTYNLDILNEQFRQRNVTVGLTVFAIKKEAVALLLRGRRHFPQRAKHATELWEGSSQRTSGTPRSGMKLQAGLPSTPWEAGTTLEVHLVCFLEEARNKAVQPKFPMKSGRIPVVRDMKMCAGKGLLSHRQQKWFEEMPNDGSIEIPVLYKEMTRFLKGEENEDVIAVREARGLSDFIIPERTNGNIIEHISERGRGRHNEATVLGNGTVHFGAW